MFQTQYDQTERAVLPVGKETWTDRCDKKPWLTIETTMERMEKDSPGQFRTMMGVLNGMCPSCGKPVKHNAIGRPKRFCSEHCRSAWNHRHSHPENWKDTSRNVVCPVCGKEFIATREYGTLRKYCSHACTNRGRAEARKKGEKDR